MAQLDYADLVQEVSICSLLPHSFPAIKCVISKERSPWVEQ